MIAELCLFGTLLSMMVVLVSAAVKSRRDKKRNPPGPSGMPCIGNLLDVNMKSLHLDFMRWKDEYGDIVMLELNGKKLLVLNSVETIRKAFENEDFAPYMSDRSLNFIGEHIFFGYKDVLLRRYDEEFRKLKTLMVKSMSKYGFQSAHFQQLMSEEISHVLSKFTETKGQPVDPMAVLMPSFCNIIAMLFTGRRYTDDDKFLKCLIDFEHNGDIMIQPQVHAVYKLFPWIRHLPGFYGNLYRKVMNGRSELLNKVEEMKKSYSQDEIRCFIHDMMSEQEGTSNSTGNTWLTDEHICGMMMDLINTSVLTTKAMISGFLFLLVHFPEMQEKIRKEIEKVIGNRNPSLADMTSMPYTRACMMEALRYQSHLPLTAPHANLDHDVKFEDYDIPKGTVIFGNLFTCHHDESVFEDPWTFKPERFLEEDGSFVSESHPALRNFIGFGVGIRYCVGKHMAISRFFIYVSNLLKKFKVQPPEGSIFPPHDPRQLQSAPPVILPPSLQYVFTELQT